MLPILRVQPRVAAPARVLAASYAHNQLYYDHSDLSASHRKRWAAVHPVHSQLRKAAAGFVSVLKSARDMREAAHALQEWTPSKASGRKKETDAANSRDEKEMSNLVKQLVTSFNSFAQSLDETGPYLTRSVKGQLLKAAAGFEQYGIRQHEDGTVELDEEKLNESLGAQFEQVRRAFAGQGGLADRLIGLSERLEQRPTSAWVNARYIPSPPLVTYQYQTLRGLPFQTGMVLDAVI